MIPIKDKYKQFSFTFYIVAHNKMVLAHLQR